MRDGAVDRRQVLITMIHEACNPTVTFTLHNAWPTKCVGMTLLNPGRDEMAIEELTLVCEGIETSTLLA